MVEWQFSMDFSHFSLVWAFGVKAHLNNNLALEASISLKIETLGYPKIANHLPHPGNILLHSKARGNLFLWSEGWADVSAHIKASVFWLWEFLSCGAPTERAAKHLAFSNCPVGMRAWGMDVTIALAAAFCYNTLSVSLTQVVVFFFQYGVWIYRRITY